MAIKFSCDYCGATIPPAEKKAGKISLSTQDGSVDIDLHFCPTHFNLGTRALFSLIESGLPKPVPIHQKELFHEDDLQLS